MSWSVGAIGKPKAVRAAIKKQFDSNKCAEPEETFRKNAGALIDAILGDFSDNQAVQVDAIGSQSVTAENRSHSLSVQIVTKWGFVE